MHTVLEKSWYSMSKRVLRAAKRLDCSWGQYRRAWKRIFNSSHKGRLLMPLGLSVDKIACGLGSMHHLPPEVTVLVVMDNLYRVCQSGWTCSLIAVSRCCLQVMPSQVVRTWAWRILLSMCRVPYQTGSQGRFHHCSCWAREERAVCRACHSFAVYSWINGQQ